MSAQDNPTADSPQTTPGHNPEVYVAEPTVEVAAPAPIQPPAQVPTNQAAEQHPATAYPPTTQLHDPLTQQPQPAATPAPAAPAPKPATPSPLGAQNVFSVLSVILAFIFPIAGVIFGHIGLSQVKKTREPGRGLAITGLTVGYILTVLGIIAFFIWISLIAFFSYAAMGYDHHSLIYDLENL